MNKHLLKSIFTVGLYSSLSIGCTHSNSLNDDGSVINVSTTTFAPVDSFFSSCDYTILETSDNAILGGSSIFHTSDKYIVAYSEDCGFNVFDRTGKHISQFSNFGQGPGESSFITDFYINGDDIICVPFAQPKLLAFNVISGDLISETTLPDSYYYATALNNDLIALSPLYSNSSDWNVDIYDSGTNRIVERYLPYEHRSSVLIDGFNVFVGHGRQCVYGVLPFDHNLYRISAIECTIAHRYQFDTPEQIDAVNPATANIAEMSTRYLYERVVKWLGKYCEVTSGAHFQHFNLLCEYGITPFLCKFSGTSSHSITLRIGVELFSQFPYLVSEPFEMKNGYYICAVAASSLLYIDKSHDADTFAKLGLQEDSNPVVFFYKLIS